jgi:hypothetical protein
METTLTTPIRDERLAGGLAVLVAAAALAVASFSGSGSHGGAGPYAVGLAVTAVLALVLFGRVLPAAEHPARAGWFLAALALATGPVFWSGLPFALGFGAAYCGARAGRAGPVVLGLLAVAASVLACFIG